MTNNSVRKNKNSDLYAFWKIDRIAYDQGQMPEWLNDFIDPDSFFENRSGVVRLAIGDSMKSPCPYEGDYLIVKLDKDGNIPKKIKIKAMSEEDFEEQR